MWFDWNEEWELKMEDGKCIIENNALQKPMDYWPRAIDTRK